MLALPQVRVDHRNGTLHFGGQQLESEKVRVHLSSLAGRLSKAVVMIDAPVAPDEDAARSAKRLAAIKHAMEHSNEEHKLMNARKVTQGGGGEGGSGIARVSGAPGAQRGNSLQGGGTTFRVLVTKRSRLHS